MEIKNMSTHELAQKTYKDIQNRKENRIARKRKAECECRAMKIEAVMKANKVNKRRFR